MSRDIGWTLPLCCHPLETHDMAAERASRWGQNDIRGRSPSGQGGWNILGLHGRTFFYVHSGWMMQWSTFVIYPYVFVRRHYIWMAQESRDGQKYNR